MAEAMAMGSSNGCHEVQLFEHPARLGQQVARAFSKALAAGGAAIAIARPLHLDEIVKSLTASGVDCEAATQSGSLLLVNAELMLANLVVDGRLDRTQFEAHVVPAVRSLVQRGGPVQAYGEMVDLLLAAGNSEAMLSLERLWGELLATEPFRLLCGYRLSGFAFDSAMFDSVLAAHDCAHPTDASMTERVGLNNALAQLEQRAIALQAEVERRQRVETLLTNLVDVTADLAKARSWDDIAHAVVHAGPTPVGAFSIAIWVLDAGGELRLLDPSASSADRIRIDSDTPVATCVRERASVQRGALSLVPCTAGETTLGALSFTYADDHAFDDAENTYQTLLARHCALALERVHFLDEERGARALAEDAARSREEILSVVSHDLRNPLGTIMMGASALLSFQIEGLMAPRVRTTAERIQRQAERMSRQITDLVDFASIQSGRLAIARAKHAPHDILSTAGAIFEPIATERGLRLETEAAMALPAIDCDCDRVVQILSSLVSNALRVTPKGGQIAIGASVMRLAEGSQPPSGGEIVFYVRDTGPGIGPEDLPKLFGRYWRGAQTAYHGTGLGLSIARGIVDAHGGRIWAESRLGTGSTFYFSLAPTAGN